jgi:hypothetical protein
LDKESARLWLESNGINVLGTPLGTSEFIESYFFGKGIKHRQLMSLIQEVVATGFPREAVSMLTGASCPRLTHLLKYVEKNSRTESWMREIYFAHLATWLHCLSASPNLENAMDPTSKDLLIDWLDLPPSYGGTGLNSLSRSADEDFLGSFTAIAASLISFCRKSELPVYIRIARAMESLGDIDALLGDNIQPSTERPCVTLEAIRFVSERATATISLPTKDELALATHLIRGNSVVEVLGKWIITRDSAPIVLPETKTIADFNTAPCKQEVSLMKETRQARHASDLFKYMDPSRQTLLRDNFGQCGRDCAHCSLKIFPGCRDYGLLLCSGPRRDLGSYTLMCRYSAPIRPSSRLC